MKLNPKYRWIVLGVFYGLWMFLIMSVLYEYGKEKSLSAEKLSKSLILWMVAGLAYGYFMKWVTKKTDKKIKNEQPENT